MDNIGHIVIQTVWISIPEFIRLAFAGMAGGLVGAYVNDRLTRRREAEKASDDRMRQDEQSRAIFRSAICALKAQVGKVDDGKFPYWFSNMMQVEVEKQCALVEGAVRLAFRKDFVAARKKCEEPQTQNNLMDDRAPFGGQLPCGPDRIPDVTYRRGRTRAIGILDSLLSASK